MPQDHADRNLLFGVLTRQSDLLDAPCIAAAGAGYPRPALLTPSGYHGGSRHRYTLTRLHARGGIGQVWLARDEDLGRNVALKELRPERSDNPAVWKRFLAEARITGQLEHP